MSRRPPKTKPAPRSFGLVPPQLAKAAEQIQAIPHAPSQPVDLPKGTSGRSDGARVGIQDADSIRFIVIGDSGGVQDASYQDDVAQAMIARLVQDQTIAFAYHVGDEVYFNGDQSEYENQFYEPYAHFDRPIVGVPGNHDGWPDPQVSDPTQTGIQTFLDNFCTPVPAIPAADPQLEYGRHTQTQPYCDWTLELQAVTIVGVWSNVPSGGHLFDSQQQWLAQELQAAPQDRPLILVAHHPCLSVDAHHGGSKPLTDALDAVFAQGRHPDLVLAGHVHDYQRFTRAVGEAQVPYVVVGNSGYHHLHALAADAQPGEAVIDGVTFEYGDAANWGFLVLTVAGGKISGEYVQVGRDGSVSAGADTFTA